MWNQQAINNHKQAAINLSSIKDEVAKYIYRNKESSEFELTELILKQLKFFKMKTDNYLPMVAFAKNTNKVHYEATKNKSLKLKPETLIMVDMWGGMDITNAPFADMTWMYYFGSEPQIKYLEVFNIVKKAQDIALQEIINTLSMGQMPLGSKIHHTIKKYISSTKYVDNLNNYTGHSLGFSSSHGRLGSLNQHSTQSLLINVGYTIEPEIDMLDFGIRLELDFYISDKKELFITTDKQEELTLINN